MSTSDIASARAFDPTKPVQTVGGRKARIIATDRNDAVYPVVALVSYDDGSEAIETYTSDGRLYSSGDESDDDLINATESVTRFIHIIGFGDDGRFVTKTYESEAEPIPNQRTIGVLKVTVAGNRIKATQVG